MAPEEVLGQVAVDADASMAPAKKLGGQVAVDADSERVVVGQEAERSGRRVLETPL